MRFETGVYLTIYLIQGKVTLKTTTTYGIKGSVPPKLRGRRRQVEHSLCPINQTTSDITRSIKHIVAVKRAACYLYDIIQLSVGRHIEIRPSPDMREISGSL
jgi:hypothetical protein